QFDVGSPFSGDTLDGPFQGVCGGFAHSDDHRLVTKLLLQHDSVLAAIDDEVAVRVVTTVIPRWVHCTAHHQWNLTEDHVSKKKLSRLSTGDDQVGTHLHGVSEIVLLG